MPFKKIDFIVLGSNVKTERLKHDNLSRGKLAAKCELSEATILSIETRAETSLLRNVVTVAKALNVPFEKLLY